MLIDFLLVLPIVMRLVLIDYLDHAENIDTNYAIIDHFDFLWKPTFSNSSKTVGLIFSKFKGRFRILCQ